MKFMVVMFLKIFKKYKKAIITVTFVLGFYVLLFSNRPYIPTVNIHEDESKDAQTKHKLAILVPFRDRFDELMVFVPHLTKYLNTQNLGPFKIFILNQSSRYRFNRGALVNVGFLLAGDEFDYIAIHDVDILPLNNKLSYAYPEQGPFHVTSPNYHPQYNYDRYFGGILLISKEHFKQVNGMSNRYFGWGLEDDEFYTRIRAANLPIKRPENLNTNKTNTFLHIHYKNRKRDMFKSAEQKEILRRRDRQTGLSDIKYSLTSSHDLTVDKYYNCEVFNIELSCDTKITPWCLYNYVQKQNRPNQTRPRTTTQPTNQIGL